MQNRVMRTRIQNQNVVHVAYLRYFLFHPLGPVFRKSRKTPTRLFCKAGLLICCKAKKTWNNCNVSCLETLSFCRCKENYVTPNAPEKFRDFEKRGRKCILWLSRDLKTVLVALYCKKLHFIPIKRLITKNAKRVVSPKLYNFTS